MSDVVSEVFWAAVDDLHAGRAESFDSYLKLVPDEQRDTLAAMLADVLVDLGPSPEAVDRESADYAAALAAIDEVSSSAGPTGVLPGALKAMRHARGIDRDEVLAAIAEEFDITSDRGKSKLRRCYHALESGRLLGSKLSHRLLAVVATRFVVDLRDLIDAALPSGPASRPAATGAAALGMARGSGEGASEASALRAEDPGLPPDPDEQRVEQLFFGGPDA